MQQFNYFSNVHKTMLYDSSKMLDRHSVVPTEYTNLTKAKRKRINKLAAYATRSLSGK